MPFNGCAQHKTGRRAGRPRACALLVRAPRRVSAQESQRTSVATTGLFIVERPGCLCRALPRGSTFCSTVWLPCGAGQASAFDGGHTHQKALLAPSIHWHMVRREDDALADKSLPVFWWSIPPTHTALPLCSLTTDCPSIRALGPPSSSETGERVASCRDREMSVASERPHPGRQAWGDGPAP